MSQYKTDEPGPALNTLKDIFYIVIFIHDYQVVCLPSYLRSPDICSWEEYFAVCGFLQYWYFGLCSVVLALAVCVRLILFLGKWKMMQNEELSLWLILLFWRSAGSQIWILYLKLKIVNIDILLCGPRDKVKWLGLIWLAPGQLWLTLLESMRLE